MWYTSGTGWVVINDVPEPLYVIKYARSHDGISWERPNQVCIHPNSDTEVTARAAVLKKDGKYRMWFCYRGSLDFRDGTDSYRIGYVEADDPIHWQRDDSKAGIGLGPDSWDAKMIAYPAVLECDDSTYLFYNGNGFGVHGFGCAVWE